MKYFVKDKEISEYCYEDIESDLKMKGYLIMRNVWEKREKNKND